MVYMLSKQQHTLLSPSTTSLRASPAIPPSPKRASSRRTVQPVRATAAAAGGGEVPSPEKRKTMNIILAGGASLPAVSMLGPFLKFFYPPSEGGAGGSQRAKDIQGVDIKLTGWLQSHPQPGARDLAQGLRGDPTYIITNSEGTGIENFGINSICTHLGCVVPWQGAENKFICPCHGSQYDPAGKVVRGPGPLSLALAHTDVQDDGQIMFSAWEETDFRDNSTPWWK